MSLHRCPRCGARLKGETELGFWQSLQYELDNLHRYAFGMPPKAVRLYCVNKKVLNKTYNNWLKLKEEYKKKVKERNKIISQNKRMIQKNTKMLNKNLADQEPEIQIAMLNEYKKNKIVLRNNRLNPKCLRLKKVPPKPKLMPRPNKYIPCKDHYRLDAIAQIRGVPEHFEYLWVLRGNVQYYKIIKKNKFVFYTYDQQMFTLKRHEKTKSYITFS